MDNTERLLRAFIEASGFDIEMEYIPLDDMAISTWNNRGQVGKRPVPTIDYKVTKKTPDELIGWDNMTKKEKTMVLENQLDGLRRTEKILNSELLSLINNE